MGYNPPAPRRWSENPRYRNVDRTRRVPRRAPMDWYGLAALSLFIGMMAAWLIAFAIDPEAFQKGARR